jgi:hypothetical protein
MPLGSLLTITRFAEFAENKWREWGKDRGAAALTEAFAVING